MRIPRTLVLFLLTFLPITASAQTKPTTRPLDRLQLPPGTHVEKNIDYGGKANKAQALDLYLPDKPTGLLPLVIYVHGGGWLGGDKAQFPGRPLLLKGYAVASVNYRFANEAIYPAQIQDCKGAVRWLRAHAKQYQIDPDRFGVWGDSAGGHLVALLGTSGDSKDIEGDVGGNLEVTSAVQAVVDWYGPTDMSVFFDQAKSDNVFKPNPAKSPIAILFGGPPADRADLVRLGNPITFITKNDPPILIMHGDQDKVVPLAQSQMFLEALQKAGVDSKLHVIEGAGHGFDPRKTVPEVEAFFNDKLKVPAK